MIGRGAEYSRPVRVLALIASLSLAALGTAQSPRREGSYAPTGAKATAWRIDDHHTLVWGDARYTPVGARVDGTVADIDAANAAGIKDLLIDLPATGDWETAVAAAEKNGQRYLIRVSSLGAGAPGVAVDPAAYRIAGVTGSRHLDYALPGSSRALVVVALQSDPRTVLSTSTAATEGGRLLADTKVNKGLQNVVLLYPQTERLALADLWEGFDAQRDALLARLRRTGFGPGLRGIVNPLGRTTMPGREAHGVPISASFQEELAAVLERKHNTVANAMTAWSLSASSLSTSVSAGVGSKATARTTFADLARLVPLWADGRGVSMLWDPSRDKTFACDFNRSRAWEDIEEAIQTTAARRLQRLCGAIRRVVDVPVVQEWSGWAGITEQREPPFDGVAARVVGNAPSELLDSASRAVSTAARWTTRGWLLATEVSVPLKSLPASLDDLANIGMRAAFVDGAPKDVAALAAQRAATPPVDTSVDPLFFPENAANPAAVQRLPGGRIWLPTPEDGNRLDLGDQFYGYRIATPKGNRVVMWARTPGRYLLRMMRPLVTTVTSMDGTDPAPKAVKNGLLVDIGQFPVVIDGSEELPVPDLAIKETIDAFGRLTEVANAGRRVGTDEIYAFTQAASAVDLNPGGSFTTMRGQLRRFASYLSPLTWVEAEAPTDTTFSEFAPMPGASGDKALVLRASLPSEDGYGANYAVKTRNSDEVDLWVAARLSPERRREIEVTIGGVTLVPSEPPVSSYGDGFAWYRLGKTRLSVGVANVSLRMRSEPGAEAAIDAIVFAPAGWRPNGVSYPYDLIVPPGKP